MLTSRSKQEKCKQAGASKIYHFLFDDSIIPPNHAITRSVLSLPRLAPVDVPQALVGLPAAVGGRRGVAQVIIVVVVGAVVLRGGVHLLLTTGLTANLK